MAYDEKLAERVRALLTDEPLEVREQKMFGGLSFMVGGNMAVGVMNDELLVRVDPMAHDAMVEKPHARIFDTMGRPARGWLLVAPEGIRSKRTLATWVARGTAFARSLPGK